MHNVNPQNIPGIFSVFPGLHCNLKRPYCAQHHRVKSGDKFFGHNTNFPTLLAFGQFLFIPKFPNKRKLRDTGRLFIYLKMTNINLALVHYQNVHIVRVRFNGFLGENTSTNHFSLHRTPSCPSDYSWQLLHVPSHTVQRRRSTYLNLSNTLTSHHGHGLTTRKY